MRDKSDHWHVGYQDAAAGNPRYKFQDAHLQKEYDAGYNSFSFDDEPTRRYCRNCGRQMATGPSNYYCLNCQ